MSADTESKAAAAIADPVLRRAQGLIEAVLRGTAAKPIAT